MARKIGFGAEVNAHTWTTPAWPLPSSLFDHLPHFELGADTYDPTSMDCNLSRNLYRPDANFPRNALSLHDQTPGLHYLELEVTYLRCRAA
jgi:hypothetical protein